MLKLRYALDQQKERSALALQKYQTALTRTEEDQKDFLEKRKARMLAEEEERVNKALRHMSYKQEELNQLTKMYKDDQVAEETEEIILKRLKNELGESEFAVQGAKLVAELAKLRNIHRLGEDYATAVKEKQMEEQTEEVDYEALAKLKGDMIRAKDRLAELQKKVDQVQVTEADLAKVIALWTGIPASKIQETEYTKLIALEDHLKARVIGQDEAVSALAKAIKRTRVQLTNKRRPASFIFVGPTGVGKTELVKVLSEELFDDNDPLIRLDMTEFMEKHAVARMIGSPPGYVGYDEAGQLTEKVRRKPYSVILFDEIEKAHPDVMNILMQILDEGKIDDAQGRTVSFANTIICMTSNAGSTDKSIGVGFNRTEEEVTKERAMKALREFLRPEFIGRIDEIIVFNKLTKDDYAKIAGLMLNEMKEPLLEKQITLNVTEDACKLIAEKAYGKTYGAREIRRVIRQEVEDQIAECIIHNANTLRALTITAKDGKLVVQDEEVTA
mgnify:CR=1 FL=1